MGPCYAVSDASLRRGTGGSLKEGDPVNARARAIRTASRRLTQIYPTGSERGVGCREQEGHQQLRAEQLRLRREQQLRKRFGRPRQSSSGGGGLLRPRSFATLKNGLCRSRTSGASSCSSPALAIPTTRVLTVDCIGNKNDENVCGYLYSFPGTGFSAGGGAMLNVIPMLIQ